MAPAALAGARVHVALGVAVGAVVYLACLKAFGGMPFDLVEMKASRGPHLAVTDDAAT
jgi:hypothetical protein